MALDKLHRCSVARLAVSVVVDDREDDCGDPDQGRPVGSSEVDRKRRGEARPDNDEGAVEEPKSVDVNAVGSQAPAGRWKWLASDTLE